MLAAMRRLGRLVVEDFKYRFPIGGALSIGVLGTRNSSIRRAYSLAVASLHVGAGSSSRGSLVGQVLSGLAEAKSPTPVY